MYFGVAGEMQVVYVCMWPTPSLCHRLAALPELVPPARVWPRYASTTPLIANCGFMSNLGGILPDCLILCIVLGITSKYLDRGDRRVILFHLIISAFGGKVVLRRLAHAIPLSCFPPLRRVTVYLRFLRRCNGQLTNGQNQLDCCKGQTALVSLAYL